jgi:hypothetical protein
MVSKFILWPPLLFVQLHQRKGGLHVEDKLAVIFQSSWVESNDECFFCRIKYKYKHENREFLANFGSLVMIRVLVGRLQKFRLSLLDGVISLMTADWLGEKVLIRIGEAPDREEGHFVWLWQDLGEPVTFYVGEGIGKSLEFS